MTMPGDDDLTRLTSAQNLPEAQLVEGLLANAGIACLIRKPLGMDVPQLTGAGIHEVLVLGRHHGRAAEIVAEYMGIR